MREAREVRCCAVRCSLDVAAVRIITAEEALAEFRNDSGFGKALDVLRDNPLPDTLVVTPTLIASTPQGTETLRTVISGLSDVQTVQIDTDWVKRLHAMLDLLRRRARFHDYDHWFAPVGVLYVNRQNMVFSR